MIIMSEIPLPPGNCRNSKQGRFKVVDDNGFTCERTFWNSTTGCCLQSQSKPKNCDRCNSQYDCCLEFEQCVSCCLFKEENVDHIIEILDFMKIQYPKFHRRSIFDLCELRCRHSSSSVVHSKEFRSSWKHCYGKKKSPLLISS